MRAEARTGAVGGADVEGHTDKRNVVLAHFAYVLKVRGLEERVDAGPVRQFATLKATDLGLVLDGIDAFQAEFLAAPHFLLPLARRNLALIPKSFHALEFWQLHFSGVFPMFRGMALVEGHGLLIVLA